MADQTTKKTPTPDEIREHLRVVRQMLADLYAADPEQVIVVQALGQLATLVNFVEQMKPVR